MLSIHLLEKNETLPIFERNQMHMHVCRPNKKGTTIQLQLTTCVLLRHNTIITLIHFGMIITGTVKNEFTVRI